MKGEPLVILLIEDDDAHAEIVRRNFEDFRIANRLIRVSDGQEALDYLYRKQGYEDPLQTPSPSLILLDLRLPRVDGLEVLAIIKADPSLSLIPVVILTTSAAERDVSRAYSNQANSYLVKPVDHGQFVDMMRSLGYYWLMWNKFPYEP